MKKVVRRYPGPKAFEPHEQHLFFGRAEETDRLLAQVKEQNLVIVFSKSGIGKSSLVNAGLRPLLSFEGFHSIPVRVQDISVSPVEAAKDAIKVYLDEKKLLERTGLTPEQAGLWENMRACNFTQYGSPVVPVLIFDQFEEFFEHATSAREEWATELGDLISERLPNRIKEDMASIPSNAWTALHEAWFKPVPLRVLCAIRSDRLSLIDYLKAEIPSILNTSSRFHLEPLNREKARDAIVRPAEMSSTEFTCPPFKFQAEAIEVILDELVDKKTRSVVESFQLQLICQHLESEIIEGQLDPGEAGLGSDAFGGRAGVQQIIENYYENTIRNLPEASRNIARRFIEDGLIYDGRRIGIPAGMERDKHGVEEELIKTLQDKRLIRAVDNSFGRTYEISHDAFLAPMLKSKEKYDEKQRMARLAAESAEQERMLQQQRDEIREKQARLEEERKLKEEALVARIAAEESSKMAKRLSYISLGITALTLAFGIYAWLLKCESHEVLGNFFSSIEEYDKAKDQYVNARQWGFFPNEKLDSLVGHMEYKKVQFTQHQEYTTNADSLAELGDKYLSLAKKHYKQAHALGYDTAQTYKSLQSLDEVMGLKLEEYKGKAKAFLEAGGWKEAEAALLLAQEWDSTDYEVRILMDTVSKLKKGRQPAENENTQ